MDQDPVWSPDGNWIAFSTDRNGNWDVYAVPADGGATRRLTYHTGTDIATDWTADGKYIVMSGSRDKPEAGVYMLDVNTLKIREMFLDHMRLDDPKVSMNSGKILYKRFQFPEFRPRYAGSQAAQLWIYDIQENERREVRDTGFQHLWPALAPNDDIYAVTVSELTPSSSNLNTPPTDYTDTPDKTPNVYRIQENGSATRLTDHVGGSVRYLTVADRDGLIAYEYDGEVFTMRPGEEAQKVEITALIDNKENLTERLVITGGADAAALSPDKSTFVFEVRNELWSVPVNQGDGPNARDAEQLTEWAGLDRAPLYHPDGHSVFFTSDRGGAEQLYLHNFESGETTLITEPLHDVIELQLTPDLNGISFWLTGEDGGLFRIPLQRESQEEEKEEEEGAEEGTEEAAEEAAEPEPEPWEPMMEMVIDFPRQYKWETSTDYAWSPDMRYVAYSRPATPPGDGANIHIFDTRTGEDINITQLNTFHGEPSWSEDGKYLYFAGNRGSNALFQVPLQPEQARETERELEWEEPEETPEVIIDFEDITERIDTLVSASISGNILQDKKTGHIYYLQGGNIQRVNYDGEGNRSMTGGGGIGRFDFSADGDRLVYEQSGNLRIMNIRNNRFPVNTVGYRAEWVRDVTAERRAAYQQLWREFNRGFYDPNFHGRDWAEIGERYQKFLPAVAHRREFATLLNYMVHELEGSHSEIGPAGGGNRSESAAHPGFLIDYSYQGPGIKIKEVPEGSPGSFEKTKLEPGEYVMAINGVDVNPDEHLWREVLVGENGRDMTLLVNSVPSKNDAREVTYRAVSGGAMNGMDYRNTINWRRDYVDEMSDGKVAYIHIAGMGGGNFAQFNREAWEFIRGKDAVIIDVRGNGGGNISDSLIDLIEREPNYFYKLRDAERTPQPTNNWNGLPTVVMHSQTSFSNAEMFPYSMRQRGFATLVGMPTPGYVIGTYGLGLVDGTRARMPTWGVYRLDGSPMENLGEEPDIWVEWPAEDYVDGKDPQLDAAIEEALRKVD
jgi:Tol biopolymer transport system component